MKRSCSCTLLNRRTLTGHNDDGMFKAFVCHDGIFNTLSGYYATEEVSGINVPPFDGLGALTLLALLAALVPRV